MSQDFKFNIGDIVKTKEGVKIFSPACGYVYSDSENFWVLFRFYDGINNVYVLKVEDNISLCTIEDDLELVTPSKSPYIPQDIPENKRLLDVETYNALMRLGILDTSVRAYNRGKSDYPKHIIQPWSIWIDYNLNAFDADIVKRILRTKEGEPRRLDYEKIIHVCEERIRQLDNEQL